MSGVEEQLEDLSRQVEALQDLFRRRLLEDRDKRQMIEALSSKLERTEKALAAEAERPLVAGLALVIDRLEDQPVDPDGFLQSIAEELVQVLESRGVARVEVTTAFDPRRHEVLHVEGGTGEILLVTRVLRHGYEKAGVILRPAQVSVTRVSESVIEQPNPTREASQDPG